MALNGTLEELAVLDVVQLVNQAHLSGALVIENTAGRADLFYRKGALVHAQMGPVSGTEVLVRIVDWTAGNFTFQPGVESTGETIRMDLHRAVMFALKTRDERKLEAEKRLAEEARLAEEKRKAARSEPTLQQRLERAIEPFEFAQQAVLFDKSGILVAASKSGDDLSGLCVVLNEFIGAYSRGRFRRAILDDEKGTVLVAGLPGNRWAAIAAAPGVPLGTVMAGTGKLLAKLSSIDTTSKGAPREVLAGAV